MIRHTSSWGVLHHPDPPDRLAPGAWSCPYSGASFRRQPCACHPPAAPRVPWRGTGHILPPCSHVTGTGNASCKLGLASGGIYQPEEQDGLRRGICCWA